MATLKDVADRANGPMSIAYEVLMGSTEVADDICAAVMGSAEALNYQLNITIRDVAAYAGVSVTTVSYVVNNNPLIKPATRQRVRNAIRDLGYHPNTTARNLKANATRMIGYAWHVAEDPIRRNPLLDLFLYELAEHGELRVKRLIAMKVPFATYGKSNEDWDFPYVEVDSKRGIQLAVEHLIAKGHERIALISYVKGTRFGDLRTEGFLEAMERANLPVLEGWAAHSPNTLEHAIHATQQILAGKPRPTAIICANDVMAFGAKKYIESLGLEVGTDVALVGYDDTPVAELIGLSSIQQPIPLIADKVIELLLADINHQRPADHHIVLEPTLMVRQSSSSQRR